MRRERGSLIVIEGIDGAGKTTISRMLVNILNKRGYRAIYTYEPYDTKFVEALKSYNEYRSAELDALAYASDRLIHLKTVVLPAMEKGIVVVMDRYYFSSMAYQGAQGAPVNWVREVNRFAIKPDLAIYIDVDPVIGLTRISGGERRFAEYEKLDLLKRVRKIYLDLVKAGLLHLVDGMKSVDEVFRSVLSIIDDKLNLGIL